MRLMKLVGMTALAGAAFASVAQARDFTIASWGGAYQDVLRDVYFKPFAAKEGTAFLEDVYLGGWAQFEAMAKTNVVNWDVVQVETSELLRGCDEGTFVELDWSKIAPKETFIPGAASRCGLGTIVVGLVASYNADLVKTEPTKLTDFWDLNGWPGKRGMRKGPKFNMELALLADGVAQADVYKVLSTPEGIDRAFKKLDEIKPQIQWWEAGDQPPSWLTSGDVAMTISYNARISIAQKEGKKVKIIWDKFVFTMDSWAIPKGAEHQDTAYKFLAYFAQAEPEIEFAKRFGYGVPNVEAGKAIAADLAETLPVGTKMEQGLFTGSDEAMAFWQDYGDSLNERWNAWASKN